MLKNSILFTLLVCFSLLSALSNISNFGSITIDTLDPEVELHTPNGNEIWYFGDTQDILWTASDDFLTNEAILLEVSYSGNQNFETLQDNYQNSGSYPWLIPEIASSNCYIQITATDMLGNSTSVYSANSFSLSYVPPQSPTGVDVDLSNGVDALLSWTPVTETIYDTPIIPDGYIILYNETPYEDDENRYYFLGYSPTANYIHNHVATFRDEFYYTVKSYKNFSARQLALLDQLSANKLSKAITWGQVKSQLQNQGALK